jgi:hypothetical protein
LGGVMEQRVCAGCGTPVVRTNGGPWEYKEGPLIMAYYPAHEPEPTP